MSEEVIELFCDGSVNPKIKTGFGAYFIFDEKLKKQNIKIKRFEDTSSTKLELEVLLWALEDNFLEKGKIIVYTDCQNILTLLDRKKSLEKNNYFTKSGKKIRNYKLYKDFYRQNEKLSLCFKKVKGHKKTELKDEVDKLFNLVDKASRRALRDFL
ncbi:ribonuclease HI [Halarcobacter anaerophilus]|jgi:ribonuclease HI|uniref:ribonuclease HI n=1 Tax=Halarcobacter anaerophilus TaxID=877500 RepID=UPI0005CB2476|nr:RNase H family protein [Halarcobacter anaerophilus]